MRYVRWFEEIRLKDVPEVDGKTASLGELHALLAADRGRVPDGFALTPYAYRKALTAAGAWQELRKLLTALDHHNVAMLAERAAAARKLAAVRGQGDCGAGSQLQHVENNQRNSEPLAPARLIAWAARRGVQ
jgi:Pyruvate phosphate dikinase, AMP/ATP-binding domain